MKIPNIKLISASAGSGKTWSLTWELSNGLKAGLRPEAIIATTFTNKAAGELVQRARETLLESGDWEKAQRILDGYMGTVNSVCGRFLKDYAFDAGLSPTLDVLPDGEDATIFAIAASPVIGRYAAKIAPIARRLETDDWREEVKRIVDLARSNNLKPSDLHRCAETSWDSLKKLLPKPVSDEKEKDILLNLLPAVEETIVALQESEDTTKKTADVISRLREFSRKYSDPSDVCWADWQKLNRNEPAKRCLPLIEKLAKLVSLQPAIPLFQQDLHQFITLIFRCASESMEAFAEYKRNHGLIDFVDQESVLLRLLAKQEVRDKLSERLDALLVDEFQDTSPIQLALFLEFGAICGTSVWVGDQKQAIYGFRNTDPVLMDSVMEHLIGSGEMKVLEHSYRSRPTLVDFTSALFAESFAAHGIQKERVRLSAKREDLPGISDPLIVWRLDAKNMDQEADGIATGIRDFLGQADDFHVFDKETNTWRPVHGGDIAVLCRKNDKCEQIAAALENLGIRAAIPNEGLLAQPECILGISAIRYLVDKNDTLALAEIMHYSEGVGKGGGWFSEWLNQREKGPPRDHPLAQRLDQIRESSIHLTPAETLDVAIAAIELERQLAGWGNQRKRLANIDRLRGLALKYQEHCLANRFAATASGLVTWLSNLNEELDKQAEGKDENAVDVLTYHRAKGIEWPVVVLADLHSAERGEVFGVHINPPGDDFDAEKPLAGRTIRFWPWPYGALKKMDWLEKQIACSPEQAQTALKERRELTRLLYVGMTRARDYLILAARLKGNNCTAWLDRLEDVDGQRLLSLPAEAGESIIEITGKDFSVQTWVLYPHEPETTQAPEKVFAASPRPGPHPEYPPATLAPSHAGTINSGKYVMRNRYSLGGHLVLGSDADINEVGEVFHAFLAADRPELSPGDRVAMAERILRNWNLTVISAESLILAGDRLRDFVGKIATEDPKWFREWPMCIKVGDQKAKGWIDLLLECPTGFYIIDHKSFPGRPSDLEKKALAYAPQLAIYREAVEKATNRPVLGLFIHMPVAGEVIELYMADA